MLQTRIAVCAAARSMKFPPSENPASRSGLPGKQLLQRAQRADDIRQPARVEQFAIEMVSFAVIAQIETHDVEAAIKKQLRQRQNVQATARCPPSRAG